MKLAFGCDPNADSFKLHLMDYAKELGHEVEDFGSDDPIYANTAIKVAEAVAALAIFGPEADFLRDLVNYLVDRNK